MDPPVRLDEKPPDYATVVDVPPPTYDDAIKLDPQRLLPSTDTCAVTVVPDECDCNKTSSSNNGGGGGGVGVVAAAAEGDAVTTATTTLARVIRKSIRDIRKQLTNTVSDTAVDIEQQQQQQQQSGSEQGAAGPVAAVPSPQKPDAGHRTAGAD